MFGSTAFNLTGQPVTAEMDINLHPTVRFCSGADHQFKLLKFNAENRVIRGVAVCTTGNKNGLNQRLKGIKIVAAKVLDAERRVVDTTETKFTTHANCKYWNNQTTCPSGQVATKVVIHQADGAAVGLSLVCRKLVWN